MKSDNEFFLDRLNRLLVNPTIDLSLNGREAHLKIRSDSFKGLTHNDRFDLVWILLGPEITKKHRFTMNLLTEIEVGNENQPK